MEHLSAIDYIINKMRAKIPSRLKYHSLDHTLAVFKSVQGAAQRSNVSEHEMKLLLTAAAYHDSGFLFNYKNHEEEGCKIAQKVLPEYGFESKDIEVICNMIMATRVPQSPQTKLEKLLCDADLEYLGGEEYHTISRRLFEELNLNGHSLSEKEWLKIQISFLEQHHYWTDWALKNLKPQKEKVLQALKTE